ncbi:MAG TPA: hypothetical protein PJ984_03020 [Candidatus Saccharibacteria bacterium]|jgi:hypothetical protein|nr:hypothetical protein [Candidatus Saccharibacteria bacterium]
MSEKNGEVNGRIPPELTDGLIIAMYAGRRIFGVDIPVHYQILLSDAEEDVRFPARIEHRDAANADIVVHIDSMVQEYGCGDDQDFDPSESHEEFEEASVTFADACKIHIAASVIPHMLICSVNPRNKRVVGQLYNYMSHPDTLVDSIANELLAIGEFEVRLREEVLSRSSDEIAEINRYRLAFGCISYLASDAGMEPESMRQSVDFGDRVSSTFIDRLGDLRCQMKGWEETAGWFGMEKDEAQKHFLAETTSIELAAAFPMQLPEISMLAKIVASTNK